MTYISVFLITICLTTLGVFTWFVRRESRKREASVERFIEGLRRNYLDVLARFNASPSETLRKCRLEEALHLAFQARKCKTLGDRATLTKADKRLLRSVCAFWDAHDIASRFCVDQNPELLPTYSPYSREWTWTEPEIAQLTPISTAQQGAEEHASSAKYSYPHP